MSSSCHLVLDESRHLLLWLLGEGEHGAVGQHRAVRGEVVEGLLRGAAETLETLETRTNRSVDPTGFERNLDRGVGWRVGYLRQVSGRGDQSVDGPDGEEGDGREGEEPAQRGGPERSDQTFDEAQRRPAHQGENEGGLQKTEDKRTFLLVGEFGPLYIKDSFNQKNSLAKL